LRADTASPVIFFEDHFMAFNRLSVVLTGLLAGVLTCSLAWAHGDVTPQAVDIGTLQKLGTDWKATNPYRKNAEAIKIGSSAYNQNCARCHGLEAISGGIAPDLRKLDKDCVNMTDAKKQNACVAEMDEYYMGRFRRGITRNGAVYMPPFEGMVSQEAGWAIKSYLETRREKPLVATK
jgi:cytochrome c-550 PedF